MNDQDQILKNISEENNFRDELISSTAHSLRTSLSAMKWILKMFLDKDFGELTKEQTSMIEKTAENTNHMISMVNDMIRVNKTMNDNDGEEKLTIDMLKMFNSLIADFSAESFKRGVEIVFVKPGTSCTIESYEERVRLIFSNLIENAIKYSRDGDKIYISIKENENDFVFSIKDTGIGIPQTEQGHMFEKFYRAANAISKEPTGSGIGLYTVKKITEHLGGSIDFTSSDLGTTFNVRLKKN